MLHFLPSDEQHALTKVVSSSIQPMAGPLPELSTTLQTLSVSHNHLTGPLPSSIARSLEIRTLDLANNGFTGSVPKSA